MKKLNCEVGEEFEYWTVIDNNSVIKNGHTYITVQCKCGKIEIKPISDLKNNRSKGCRSCAVRFRRKDIQIGEKYKSWTVIEGPIKRMNTNNIHSSFWYKVQCDCGSVKLVQANELTNLNRNFQCSKCAGVKRGLLYSTNNGRVGDLIKTQFTRIKNTAKERNIEFNLSMEYLWNLYLKQNRKCALTGDNLDSIRNASLDRINSLEGYTESNVQWVTKQANLSKHIMTTNEFLEFCNKVINHANQQPS